MRASLRYAAQLLTPAAVLAATYGHTDGVLASDVAEAAALFLDAKQSSSWVTGDAFLA